MKNIIGNVVCDTNLRLNKGLKRYDSYDEVDKSLPTIIVGVKAAKEAMKNFNILLKKSKNDNLWWTFKRNERLSDYKEDMDSFYEECLNQMVNKVDYELIDMVNIPMEKAKKVINYMISDDKKYIYNDFNKFLLIYSPKHCKIWGFSLMTANYCGIRKKTVIKLLKRNENNIFIDNFSCIPFEIRRIVDDKLHKLVVLYESFS